MRDAAYPITALLACLLCLPLEAQVRPTGAPALTVGPGRVVSIVVGEAKQPVPDAAITVRSARDSAIVAGGMTDRDGRFRILGLPVGDYYLRVSHIGYKPLVLPLLQITATTPFADLGTLVLEIAPVELTAVEANVQRSPVVLEADRTVYNTRNLPASAGTAMDVLRTIPELEIDVSGRIGLRGTQSVAIHFNGRPAPFSGEVLTNYLQQLPGNRIAKVEVVPNPSAKYDPAGIGGIVNIQLRDEADLGLSGNASLNTSSRWSRGVGSRLNYQKGSAKIFSGAALLITNQTADNYDRRQNLLAQPMTYIEQRGNADAEYRNYSVDVLGELMLSKRATAWSTATAYHRANSIDGFTQYWILDDVQAWRDRFDRTRTNEGGYTTVDARAGFKQAFETDKHEFAFEVRRTTSSQSATNRLTREFFMWGGAPVQLPLELTMDDIATRTNALSGQADYFNVLGSGWRVDAGYSGYDRIENYSNRLNLFGDPSAVVPADSTIVRYRYEEIFQSLYALIGQTRGPVNVQVGLRAERASTKFDLPLTSNTYDDDYNSVFPSANLSYDAGQGRSVHLSYSKRISRPYPTLLNPVVPALDPLNRTAGNLDIKPAYTHSLSADFSKVGRLGSVRLNPFFRSTADNWENIKHVDASGVSTVTWENSASLRSFGASLTASLRTSRFSGSANIGINRDIRDASNLADDYRRESLLVSVSANAGVQALQTLSIQSNVQYFPVYELVQGRVAASVTSSVGVRQLIAKSKGSISLLLNDPLDLYRYKFITQDRTHVQNSSTSYRIRAATLSVTYNFGRPPQQASRRNTDDQGSGGSTAQVIR